MSLLDVGPPVLPLLRRPVLRLQYPLRDGRNTRHGQPPQSDVLPNRREDKSQLVQPLLVCQSVAGQSDHRFEHCHQSTTSDCIPGRAIQPNLWTWIQRREHVAIQKLHYLPRAVSAVPRGRLQPVESSDVGESFEPGNWSTRRTDDKRKVFSEQHAGRAIPAIVSEIQLLETSSRKGRLCSYAPSIFPQRYSRAPAQA
jgi:hypothetical protein